VSPIASRKLRYGAIGSAIAMLATALMVLVPMTTADAAVGDLSCLGASATVHISPGLTFTTHSARFTATGNLGRCISLSHPAITGATFSMSGSGAGNCLTGGSASATGTMHYNDPAHSTSRFNLTFTATIALGIPIVSVTSHVTAGTFRGDTMTAVPLTANLNPVACASPGGLTTASVANAVVVTA
jgi:hypothetical protein